MKLIGVLGGTSWPSTLIYYRVLNELAQQHLGGHHCARLLVYSIDYHEIRSRYPGAGVPESAFAGIAPLLEAELRALAACRPDCIILGNNTLHKSLDTFSERLALPMPLFHIVDAAAEVALARGLRRVLLLATKFTMEDGFFARRLAGHGIEAVIPDEREREQVQAIQSPLARGEWRSEYRDALHAMIARYAHLDAVMLGCTELPLAVDPEGCALPVLDTVRIQCERAFAYATGAAGASIAAPRDVVAGAVPSAVH